MIKTGFFLEIITFLFYNDKKSKEAGENR